MRHHFLTDPIRRSLLLKTAGAWLGSTALPAALLTGRGAGAQTPTAPAVVTRDAARPQWPSGLQFGDVTGDRALLWTRSDRPARLWVEYATNPKFDSATRVRGPLALETNDHIARVDLRGLPADRELFVRAMFEDLGGAKGAWSEPLAGSFRTAPAQPRDLRFVWSGDTAGQGFGINPDVGGMRIYEAMRQVRPDFFLHSGDTIYADGPIAAEQQTEDGRIWRNVVTEQVSKVAETLKEFRGRYAYNLLDENVRRFSAEVPQIWQWDDHEVMNNWSPSKDLSGDARYREKSVPLLVARATRAFLDYAPMRSHGQDDEERVYRKVAYGPLLDVFVLDMRSYRGPNTQNRQAEPGPDTTYLGRAQLDWLKRETAASQAVWKVIASDMPLGLVVGDGKDAQGNPKFENSANGDGPVLGREFEIAEVLKALQHIDNVVWLTADVHYCAAHHYAPERAQFTDFKPFWEFVAGPLNAGSFGPNALDNTFGPEVVYQNAPKAQNTSPFAGLQFFGQVDIDAKTRMFKVALKDLDGNTVFKRSLEPHRS